MFPVISLSLALAPSVDLPLEETHWFQKWMRNLYKGNKIFFWTTESELYFLIPPCKKEMFPLKLVRALVSGHHVSNNPLLLHIHHDNLDENHENPIGITTYRNRVPLLLFNPTQELVSDTYRLASIARAIGMDLQPNPSLSHIVFSWPTPLSCASSAAFSSSSVSCGSSMPSSSSSSLYSWSLPNDSVPLPFPSFSTASLSHLRLFVSLSKGYFKLAFLKNNGRKLEKTESLSNNNWHCTSLSLFGTRTSERIESMERFSKAMLGSGWSLYKTYSDEKGTKSSARRAVYLYRKLDVSRTSCSAKQLPNGNGDSGECSRVRELRFPSLDFRDMPLRILQYILLMTDDVFYLA